MSEPKNLLVYMPMTLQSLSSKVFKSFIKMLYQPIPGVNILEPLISDKFPIDLNRNQAFDVAFSNKYEADYIMCCDGDQVFKNDTISRLFTVLEENPDAGAVTGIYFRKTHPFRCVVGKYSPWSEQLEKKRGSLKDQGFIGPDGNQTLFYKPLMYFDVVQQVDAFGLGCILFRKEAFKDLKQPFCKYTNAYSTGGDFTFEGCSEDMWLCSQLKQAGVKVLCDPKVQVGHVVEKVIMSNEADE